MESKLQYLKLKDCCYFQEGYVNPSQSHPEYFDGAIKWIRAVDLNNANVYTTTRTLTEKGFKSAGKSALLFEPDTIVISKSGTIGRLGIIKDYMCGNRATINIKPKDNINLIYLFYFLRSKQKTFEDLAVGSVQKNLYVSILEGIDIAVPPLEMQEKIVSLIADIDKKIELNNNINSNLEQQAFSIYQSMFSFDNQPNGVLSDIANITMGQSPSGDSLNEESGTVFYQGRTDFGFRFPSVRLYTTEPKRMAVKNDVLLSVRAPVGDINVAIEDCCIGRGLAAIHSKNNRQSFVYYTTKSLYRAFDMFNGEGTVFGSINKVALNSMPIYIPEEKDIDIFEELVSPMDKMILENHKENVNLQIIRDGLLPKLMSGEIDLTDIDI